MKNKRLIDYIDKDQFINGGIIGFGIGLFIFWLLFVFEKI